MASVITNVGIEEVVGYATGDEIIAEPHTYGDVDGDGTVEQVYALDRLLASDGITKVTGILNGSENTFTEGTDYEELDDDGDGIEDSIDWSIGGDNPDTDTEFNVTYTTRNSFVQEVAVGNGTSSVSKSDEQMQNSLHRSTPNRKLAIDNGVRRYVIEITGGTEVPADSDISEFGLFSKDGTMIYHEVRDPITVAQGVTQEFFITLTGNNLKVS